MDSTFVIPSRHLLSTKLTPDAAAAKTAQLQKVLTDPHHVSVTLDTGSWTDRHMHSFMVITVGETGVGSNRGRL